MANSYQGENKPWRDEETLRELRVERGLTQAEIGNELGCTGVTVGQWLKKLNIDQPESEETPCPECSESFSSEKQMKQHYGRTHKGSIAGVELNCENCGDKFRVRPARKDEARFCKKDCADEWLKGENSPLYKERPTKQCARCSATFYPKNWRVDVAKYCSRQCANGYVDLTTECVVCSTEFDPPPYRWNRSENLYCSPECQSIGRQSRIEFECDHCGDIVEKVPSRRRYDNHHFCNQECSRQYFTGRNHPLYNGGATLTTYRVLLHWYDPRWGVAVKRSRYAADHRCAVCGKRFQGHNLHTHHIVPVLSGGTNADYNRVVLCGEHHQKAEAYTDDLFGDHFIEWSDDELPNDRVPSGEFLQTLERISIGQTKLSDFTDD